jgi:hypothetical protein
MLPLAQWMRRAWGCSHLAYVDCYRSVRVEIRERSVGVLVNRVLRRLHNAHYQAQGYADGVVLLQKGKFVSTLCNRMQCALHCVESWCREIGLYVNADKTAMVLFTE